MPTNANIITPLDEAGSGILDNNGNGCEAKRERWMGGIAERNPIETIARPQINTETRTGRATRTMPSREKAVSRLIARLDGRGQISSVRGCCGLRAW